MGARLYVGTPAARIDLGERGDYMALCARASVARVLQYPGYRAHSAHPVGPFALRLGSVLRVGDSAGVWGNVRLGHPRWPALVVLDGGRQ